MKLTTSAFANDELALTWLDIFKLILGRRLKVAALEVVLKTASPEP